MNRFFYLAFKTRKNSCIYLFLQELLAVELGHILGKFVDFVQPIWIKYVTHVPENINPFWFTHKQESCGNKTQWAQICSYFTHLSIRNIYQQQGGGISGLRLLWHLEAASESYNPQYWKNLWKKTMIFSSIWNIC